MYSLPQQAKIGSSGTGGDGFEVSKAMGWVGACHGGWMFGADRLRRCGGELLNAGTSTGGGICPIDAGRFSAAVLR